MRIAQNYNEYGVPIQEKQEAQTTNTAGQDDYFSGIVKKVETQQDLLQMLWGGVSVIIGIFLVLYLVRHIVHKFFAYHWAMKRKVLKVLVPKEAAQKEEEAKSARKEFKEIIGAGEAFYESLSQVKPRNWFTAFLLGREDQFSFELVVQDGLLKFYIVVPEYLQTFFEQQITAQYSSAFIEEVEDYNIFRPKGFIACAPLILTKSSIFSIKTYKKLNADPMNALTNVMSKVEGTQGAVIQFLIRTAKPGWRSKGQRIARAMQQGKSLEDAMHNKRPDKMLLSLLHGMFHMVSSGGKDKNNAYDPQRQQQYYRHSPFEQEIIKSLEEKTSKGGFEVNVRVVTSADQEHVAKMHLYNIVKAFGQYMGPESNINFRWIKYAFWKKFFLRNFIYRIFDDRRKLIFNSEEMNSLYHPPLSITETPNIEWLKARGAPPPSNLPKEGIIIGESVYRGRKQLVRILTEDRRRHMYVVGMTGVGKSTAMINMILQDIREGRGCCYIDPHGQDLHTVLANIPPERADDVILFEPGDVDRPIGLNMLEAQTEDQKDFVAQEMIAIFYRLVTDPSMIGPMFEHYMRNAMLTLMADPQNPNTIVEIPRILTDKDFQNMLLRKVTDPIIRNFWEKELPQTSGQTKGEMLPYLVSKIGRFIENNMIRNIIGQTHSGVDFREVMDKKKILLVNLSKGQIGEMNSNLLGLIVVTKLQMAALSRVNLPEEERNDFYLYIDEFQNFITDSIATILSEARKYRLDLILAHQYIAQLTPKQGDTKVRDSIFGNVGTMLVFRVGVDDSELIAKQMAPVFNQYDVMNIEKYTAYIRLLIHNAAARPFNLKMFPYQKGNLNRAQAIQQLSRLKYGRDRALVEAEIYERSQLVDF